MRCKDVTDTLLCLCFQDSLARWKSPGAQMVVQHIQRECDSNGLQADGSGAGNAIMRP